MQKSHWTTLLVVVIIIVLALVGGRYFFYNSTSASAYSPPERGLPDIEVEAFDAAPRVETVDNPTVSQGIVIIDYSHRNALFIEELNVLLSKVVARGFSYEIALPTDEESLTDRLRYAKSLILPLPRSEFTAEEIVEIEHFVDKGGKVLLIGDPTRTVFVDGLNSISSSFGLIFANDYLYNLNPDFNDNNYRNVVYSNFKSSPVTAGLGSDDKVVFYSGSSISAPDQEIIIGNESTLSSVNEDGRAMAAAALGVNDQVLALGDLTFFNEPYSAVESNGIFINNIANFLTDGTRSFELKDFPFFFGPDIDVVFDDTLVFNSQFEDSVKLKDYLEQNERTVTLLDKITGNNDAIFVGRFNETEAVDAYLAEANVTLIKESSKADVEEEEEAAEEEEEEAADEGDSTEAASEVTLVSDTIPEDADQNFVEGRIQIEGVGELELGGSTLFYLHQADDRNTLIILSDNPDTNADAFELLLDNSFTECLVSPTIAVCQTEEPDKQQLPSIRSPRVDKILVVSDDDGREREDAQTSAAEYRNALSATYKIDLWVMSDDGSLDLDELQEYDAVIWTTGDYWDDSIDQDDTSLLTKYIEAGGNLILSGASIAFDWDHTEFLSGIVHADYLSFAVQADIEVLLEGHPIAKGFDEGDSISFIETPSGEPIEPDVVNHTADARVVFQRGSDSLQAGAPSVIAYEDERSKIAYFAFPVYLLPAEEGAQLLENTIDWFTRKPLDLPDEDDYEPFEADNSDQEADDEESTEEGTEDSEDTGTEEGDEETDEGNGDEGG